MLKLTHKNNNWLRCSIYGAFAGSILLHIIILCVNLPFGMFGGNGVPLPKLVSSPIQVLLHNQVSAEILTVQTDSTFVIPESNAQDLASESVESKISDDPLFSQKVHSSSKGVLTHNIPDGPPKVLSFYDINLPAALQTISGSIIIDVTVDPTGKPVMFSILSASPPAVFDEIVIDAILKSKIQPAYLNGVPISHSLKLEVTFSGGILTIGG